MRDDDDAAEQFAKALRGSIHDDGRRVYTNWLIDCGTQKPRINFLNGSFEPNAALKAQEDEK